MGERLDVERGSGCPALKLSFYSCPALTRSPAPALLRATCLQLGAFSERCSVRFNHACTLALAGREEQAQAALMALLECGGVSAADLASDADLARVQSTGWFQQLLAAVHQPPGP